MAAAAIDYDAPRRSQAEETVEDPLLALTIRRNDARSGTADIDDDSGDIVAPPELDLSGSDDGELVMRVVPTQVDEFTCTRCFLVSHGSRLVRGANGQDVCRDCA